MKGSVAAAVNRPAPDSRRATLIYALAAAVSLVGLADAIYLAVGHLTGRSAQCVVFTGCDKVLSSPYASIAGYPLAGFGALAYFSVFSLATLAAFGNRRVEPVLAILVALMFAVTLWLFYLQAFVIHEFCSYCLLSAIVTLTLSALLLARRFLSGG